MAVEQKENDDAEDNSHHKVEEEEEILNDDMGSPEKETAGKIGKVREIYDERGTCLYQRQRSVC